MSVRSSRIWFHGRCQQLVWWRHENRTFTRWWLFAGGSLSQAGTQTPTDSPIGYILEVDLKYPHSIRDLQRDFPLAPTKEIVPDEWLSTYQRELKFSVNMPRSSVTKLLQTVTDTKLYTLHYRNIQLYVQLAPIVEKVHRVFQFSQKNGCSHISDLTRKEDRPPWTNLKNIC